MKGNSLMKKNYIKPTVLSVKVNTEQMICESLTVFGETSSVDERAGKSRGSRTADDFDELW